MPAGQIPSSDLTLQLTCLTQKDSSGNKLGSVKVYANYEWNDLPTFRWQDPIAVGWNEDCFQIREGSFTKKDRFDGVVYNALGQVVHTYNNEIWSTETSYAKGAASGVSWYADLIEIEGMAGSGVNITGLRGSADFWLDVTDDFSSASGSSKIFIHYVHATTEVTLTINFGPYGGISVSGGPGYDELGDDVTIQWNY